MMTSSNALFSSAKRFLSGTLFSRLTGLIRDISMAAAFGTHPSVAAFMVGFRFSNLFRRLLGEGALQTAFIPHFEQIKQEDPARATSFFRDLSLLLTLVLVAIVLFVEAALALSVHKGWFPQEQIEIVVLTMWMFPGLVFMCLYGLNAALLQCKDSYFIGAAAPALFNLLWIGSVLVLRGMDSTEAMLRLSQVVVCGYLLQWAVTLPGVMEEWRAASSYKRALFSPAIKRVAQALGLTVLGVGAVQINALFDAVFARYADPEGPAYLWYAIRIQQLPLALFGIAIANALLPPLTRAVKTGDEEKGVQLFRFSYLRLLTLMVPSVFAIWALGFKGIDLIFGRGEFGGESVQETSSCLFAYGAGLVPMTLVILFSSLFYARNDYRTPTWTSLAAVFGNLILNSLLVFWLHLGAVSVALATAFSAWINCYLLRRRLQFAAPAIPLHVIAASALAAVVVYFLPVRVEFGAFLFAALYFLYGKVVRCEEIESLFRAFIPLRFFLHKEQESKG